MNASVGLRPSYERCFGKSGTIEPDAGACVDIEADYQEERLTVTYKEVVASLPKSGAASLKSEEVLWIKQRDAACGKVTGVERRACMTKEAAKRATILESRLMGSGRAEAVGRKADDSGGEAVGLRAAYAVCLSRSVATSDFLSCTGRERAYQDQRLDTVRQKLLNRLGADERDAFEGEDHAWSTSMSGRCSPPDEDGSIDQVDSETCELREVAERAAELEERFRN
ncbi:DUF1311 domain-containing protein [Luteibacter sp. CQ10]